MNTQHRVEISQGKLRYSQLHLKTTIAKWLKGRWIWTVQDEFGAVLATGTTPRQSDARKVAKRSKLTLSGKSG